MKTRPSLTLSLLALLTISGGAHFMGSAPAAAIDVETLTECSDRAWEEDIAAWAGYAFERHVTRRSLDKEGETKSVNTMRFRVTPNDDQRGRQAPQGGGWLLERVELNSDAAVLGKRLRKANSYRYTDFRLQPDR